MPSHLTQATMLMSIVALHLAVASLIGTPIESQQLHNTPMISTATPALESETAATSGGREPALNSDTQTEGSPAVESLDQLPRRPEDMAVPSNELDVASVFGRPQSQPIASKSRRHASLFNPPVADWWTRMAPAKPAGKVSDSTKSASKQSDYTTTASPAAAATTTIEQFTYKPKLTSLQPSRHSTSTARPTNPPAYREQPLNQNAILTIKNQLRAIKGKHKLLITKSMLQLQQLDNRLVESYRLCMKRKMPLYAGMLYRTRDFVSRMAKEANHERRVLEAMTKQVHTVLIQKMTNRTLVKEYNRLIAAPAATASDSPTIDVIALQQQQQQLGSKTDNLQTGTQSARFNSSSQEDSSAVAGSVSLAESENSARQVQAATKNQPAAGNEISRPRDKFAHWLAAAAAAKKSPERELNKAKQNKYTVSVNEVNLKKELTKIQSLIDRINGSCYEITSVVDDIIFLFKLNPNNPDRRGSKLAGKMSLENLMMYNSGGSSSDPKQMRKMMMLRSPLKVFLEKYGKLSNLRNDEFNNGTNSSNSSGSDINIMMNLQEIKPLIEPSSLVYTEIRDPDIGFD